MKCNGIRDDRSHETPDSAYAPSRLLATSYEMETARGQVRAFKRLDAAVGMLFGLGFDGVKVVR